MDQSRDQYRVSRGDNYRGELHLESGDPRAPDHYTNVERSCPRSLALVEPVRAE